MERDRGGQYNALGVGIPAVPAYKYKYIHN